MPMIDVYTAADLFPVGTDRILAQELTGALLRAEGVSESLTHGFLVPLSWLALRRIRDR